MENGTIDKDLYFNVVTLWDCGITDKIGRVNVFYLFFKL